VRVVPLRTTRVTLKDVGVRRADLTSLGLRDAAVGTPSTLPVGETVQPSPLEGHSPTLGRSSAPGVAGPAETDRIFDPGREAKRWLLVGAMVQHLTKERRTREGVMDLADGIPKGPESQEKRPPAAIFEDLEFGEWHLCAYRGAPDGKIRSWNEGTRFTSDVETYAGDRPIRPDIGRPSRMDRRRCPQVLLDWLIGQMRRRRVGPRRRSLDEVYADLAKALTERARSAPDVGQEPGAPAKGTIREWLTGPRGRTST
jgi:hypothetical protein